MMLLAERIWPALALACGLGFLFAALGGRGRATATAGLAVRGVALLLLGATAVASSLQVVPGAQGLWLDLVVMLAGAYAAAAMLGAALRRLLKRSGDDALSADIGLPAETKAANPSAG